MSGPKIAVLDYGIGNLWRRGIDGAGTTIALIEGWHFTGISRFVAGFDQIFEDTQAARADNTHCNL